MAEDIATLALAIDSSPAAKLTTELEKLTDAAVKVDGATSRVGATINNTFNVTMVSVTNSAAAATQAVGGVVTAANDASGALGKAATAASTVAGTLHTVAAGSAATGAAASAAAAATAAHTQAVNSNVKAHGANAAAMGSAYVQFQELGHVVRAVSDEMIAGQSPIRAVGMEFGRIVEIVGQGNLGGLLSAAGSKLLGFTAYVNPITGVTAAVAGMGLAVYNATSNVEDLRKELDQAVSGVGRAAGLTGAGLGALAQRAADRNGLSVGDARGGAEAMAATGKFSAQGITDTLALTRGYAGAYQISNGEASQRLAETFANPAKGLEELDKRLGFLDDTTLRTVRSLQAQGDAQGALRAATDAAALSLNEMAKPEGAWSRFTRRFSERNEQIESALAAPFRGPTDLERYAHDSRQAGRDNGNSNDIAETLRNRSLLRGDSPLMVSELATQLAGQRSRAAGDVLHGGDGDLDRYQRLLNDRATLTAASSDPLARARTAGGVGESGAQVSGGELLDQELARVNSSLDNFRTGLQRLREEGDRAVASTLARTDAERNALAAEEARTRALEAGRGPTEAALAAQNAMTAALTRQSVAAINSALPELGRRQAQDDAVAALQRAAAGGDAALNLPAGSASAALSNAVTRREFSDPDQRASQDAALRLKSIQDYDIAERLETETRRAALAVLRETGDVVRANTAAEQARNEIVTQANQAADTRAKTAAQDLSLVGMRSYDKAMQQIENEFHGVGGYEKDEVSTRDELTKAMDPVKADLGRATQAVTDALKETPPKITAGGDAVADALKGAAAKLREATESIAAAPGAAAGYAGAIGQIGTNAIGKYSDRGLWATNDLIKRGVDPQAAAGFVGGLTGESGVGLDPHSENPTSHAYGIEQDLGVRKKSLLAMPNSDTFETQWKHLIDSLGTSVDGGGWDMLKKAHSVQAGLNANLAYEGPSAKEISDSYKTRLMNGNALNAQLQNAQPGAAPAGTLALPPIDVTASRAASTAAVPLPPVRPAELDRVALTTTASNESAERDRKAALQRETYELPLRDSNERLDDQLKLLDRQRDSLGKTTEQIKGETAAQNMLNEVQAKSKDPLTPAMISDIEKYGERVTDVAEKSKALADSQSNLVAVMDDVRSVGKGALSTLVQDLKSGKSAGDSFKDVLSGIGEKLISMGENSLVDGLLGKQGTSGAGASGGLFGSALSGLFGGAQKAAAPSFGSYGPQMPGAESGGGFLSALTSLFPHFATGTDDAPGGPSLVGERGPEIVNLPVHSQVTPNAVAFGPSSPQIVHAPVDASTSVVVQGSMDSVTHDQLQGTLAQHSAEMQDSIQRNWGTLSGNFSKRYG